MRLFPPKCTNIDKPSSYIYLEDLDIYFLCRAKTKHLHPTQNKRNDTPRQKAFRTDTRGIVIVGADTPVAGERKTMKSAQRKK